MDCTNDEEDSKVESEDTEGKYDFVGLWKRQWAEGEASQRFVPDMEVLTKKSFVYRSFRSEFELDSAFSQSGLKYLKGLQNVKPSESDKKLPKGKLLKPPVNEIPGYNTVAMSHRKSFMTREEMNECFSFLILSKNGTLNAFQQQRFNAFREGIAQEQKQFLELAKSVWTRENYKRCMTVNPDVEELMQFIWKNRLKRVEEYPNFYSQVGLYSLVHANPNNFELKFERDLETVGKPRTIFFPKLYYYKANIHSILEEVRREEELKCLSRESNTAAEDTSTGSFPEVSRDERAEALALENGVQVVMSESGFLKLINNHYPRFDSTWDLPVRIKEHKMANGEKKRIVYIDKALPPRSLNNTDKTKWYCKLSAETLFQRKCTELRDWIKGQSDAERTNKEIKSSELAYSVESGRSDSCNCHCSSQDVVFDGDENSDEEENILEYNTQKSPIGKESDDSSSDEDHLIIDTEVSSLTEKLSGPPKKVAKVKKKSEKTDVSSTCTCNHGNLPPISTSPSDFGIMGPSRTVPNNLELPATTYSLWTLKKEDQNLLMKSCTKDFKILIRRKDGFISKGQKLKISVKTEYQTEYGAEALTLSEIIKNWGSLLIRPETENLEVRLDPLSGDLIMFERHSIQDLLQKSVYLHNVKPSTCLSTLYSILEKLCTHEPGKYLLCHQPQNEAFVPLYKETNGSYIFGLHSSYRLAKPIPDNAAWNPLDVTILTPIFKHYQRLPGTFPPSGFKRKNNVNTVQKPVKTVTKVVKRGKKRTGKKKKTKKKN